MYGVVELTYFGELKDTAQLYVREVKKLKKDEFGIFSVQVCQCRAKLSKLKLMQYTGLKDKNGTEIYEGDIIKGKRYGKKCTEVIEYHLQYEGDGWIVAGYYISLDSLALEYEIKQLEDIEVVGNIYENKDLL